MRWICCIATLALLGCQDSREVGPNELLVTGRIEGDETSIAAKSPGRVIEVAAREGDPVKRGDLLVRLEQTQAAARRSQAEAGLRAAKQELETARLEIPALEQRMRQLDIQQRQASTDAAGRVAAARSQVAAAEADLARAQAELDQVEADAQRYRNLADKGAAPEQAAQQYASRVEATRAVVRAAEKQAEAARGALEAATAAEANPDLIEAEKAALERRIAQARSVVRTVAEAVDAARAVEDQAAADVDDLDILAPFDGVVVTRIAEPGQVIAPGQPLLTLVDPENLYLRGYVPQADIDRVSVGQPAEIRLDARPDEPIEGRVLRVDPEAMFTPENTYFRDDRVQQVVGLKIALGPNSGPAKLGMTGEAILRVGEP